MRKEYANYTVNLVVVLICKIVYILFNNQVLFFSEDNLVLFYGLFEIVLCVLLGITIFSVKNDIRTSAFLAKIVGPLLIISIFVPFVLDDFFKVFDDSELRWVFLGWADLIGGCVIFSNALKITKILTGDVDNFNFSASHVDGYPNSNQMGYSQDTYSQDDYLQNDYSQTDYVPNTYIGSNQDMSSNSDDIKNVDYNSDNSVFVEQSSNEVEDDGVYVDGVIKNVFFDNQSQSYLLEIEYQYMNDIYSFLVGGFTEDVSSILDIKNLRVVKVYLEHSSPDLAKIDEAGLRSEIYNSY